MLNRVKSFLTTLIPASVAERERAFLNEAVSRNDLERRERLIQNGLFRNRGFDL